MGDHRIASFPPLVDANARVLILGSIPGIPSLQKQEYYGHPQNAFWRILFQLCQEPYTTEYSIKKSLLKKHNIALWDVLDSCERKGSLDAHIKNETQNDLVAFLHNYPNIQLIACNGQKAYKTVQKIIGKTATTPIIALPSTSPAHTLPYQQKLEAWAAIGAAIADTGAQPHTQPTDSDGTP